MRRFLKIVPSTDHRDRWLAGHGNHIEWAWSAPRIMSLVSWWWWTFRTHEMRRRR